MKNEKKDKKILERSRQVLLDLSLPNGAIVAANTDEKYYPRTAKDYRYVWPRDAAYMCIAADYLDYMEEICVEKNPKAKTEEKQKVNIQEAYFNWLEDRPEDFKKDGLLLQNYSTNGKKGGGPFQYEEQFQPDQMGISLWAIWHHFKKNLGDAKKYEILIRRLADGICNAWAGSYFLKNTCDLWEEPHRMTSTRMENNFTYTLAACTAGLERALLIFPGNAAWKKTAREMRRKIDQAYMVKSGYFTRNHGKIDDLNLDASMLGLVWPFEIYDSKDGRVTNTVKKIEKKLAREGGVHRFEMDYYDGEGTAQEGAGAWPLLNFWMTIYWKEAGKQKKAQKYFNWVVERIGEDNFIPEQIYGDSRDGQGVKPLGWSHAMFIIAYHFLNNQ